MTKSRVIRVFSFIMALTLVFAMFTTQAYAVSKQQMGAWIASALTALNITWNSTVAPYYQAWDYFTDPFQIREHGVWETVPYTYDSVDDILSNNTISFSGDTITIDGKDYQNIWLSHDAAEKFRVNAFDIKNAWNIASQSQGTYVSGLGEFEDIPIFQVGTVRRSQNYISGLGSFSLGDTGVTLYKNDGDDRIRRRWTVNGLNNEVRGQIPDTDSFQSYVQCDVNNAGTLNTFYTSNGSNLNLRGTMTGQYNDQPFDFSWIAQDIPVDASLPQDNGLNFYVPTDPTQWTDDPEAQNAINEYNNYIDLNPEFSPGVDVDLDGDGILDKLADIFKILETLIRIMPEPQFGPKEQEPDPPTPPVPPTGDLIPDTPWETLENWLRDILNAIRNIYSHLINLGDDIISLFRNLVSYLRSVLDEILTRLTNIYNIINDRLYHVEQLLSNIYDKLKNLVDSLLHHDADWFEDIVEAIKKPFMRWFGILKAGVGIWHYVVEWVQYISSPFSFFFGVLTSLGGIYVSPFYAVAASCIVIAIYRRFGR